jgi:SAM-dependent methyltransferase
MSISVIRKPDVDLDRLRKAIQVEYSEVALRPEQGFHFHTGRPLARMLGYRDEWLEGVPDPALESFAGTGNPFSLGTLRPGEQVVDVGCGAGIDSLITATMVGPSGQVIGVDMTPAMLEKSQRSAVEAGRNNVTFRQGYGEALPVPDGWADVVISNGVLNLFPDKSAGLHEMARLLKPGGRLQIGDIITIQQARDFGGRFRTLLEPDHVQDGIVGATELLVGHGRKTFRLPAIKRRGRPDQREFEFCHRDFPVVTRQMPAVVQVCRQAGREHGDVGGRLTIPFLLSGFSHDSLARNNT